MSTLLHERLPWQAYWLGGAMAVLVVGLLAAAIAVGPVPQSAAYHRFADARALLGIPSFANVISNVLFLIVGVAGAVFCLGARRPAAWVSWLSVFVGTALVCAGSGYFHWNPNNATLVWDRLPMTIALMGLFVALLSEHLDPRYERRLLAPALAVGVASVVWWHYTDDQRPYVAVQLVPLLSIPLLLAMFPGRYTHRHYLLYGLGAYAVAKLAEYWDREIFVVTGNAVSGHTLKHVLAAVSLLLLYLMLGRRERRVPPGG